MDTQNLIDIQETSQDIKKICKDLNITLFEDAISIELTNLVYVLDYKQLLQHISTTENKLVVLYMENDETYPKLELRWFSNGAVYTYQCGRGTNFA